MASIDTQDGNSKVTKQFHECFLGAPREALHTALDEAGIDVDASSYSYKPAFDLKHVFANLSITNAFGGVFKVNAILAMTLCPAIYHKLPTCGEAHYDARDLFIELPGIHPFYMDRMVNSMYEGTYSTSSPTSSPWIQDGCQLSPDTFTAFGNPSPLDLEVRMWIHAVYLRSTTLRDYALMNILALLEQGVSTKDFAGAVETTFVSHTAEVKGKPTRC